LLVSDRDFNAFDVLLLLLLKEEIFLPSLASQSMYVFAGLPRGAD